MSTSTSHTVRRPADLGAAIAEIRRSRGLTQAQLAEAIGIQRPFLAAIESGRTNRLIEHILRALRRLGAEVTITWQSDVHSSAIGSDDGG